VAPPHNPSSRSRSRTKWAQRVLPAFFLATALAATGGTAASFPEFSRPYSIGGCDGAHIDPVGVLFHGDEAGGQGSLSDVVRHTGWTNSDGSTQQLRVLIDDSPLDYSCRDQYGQAASAGSTDARDHIRIWRIPFYDGRGVPYKSAGTPHSEYYDCGQHQIYDENASGDSGYDVGRQVLKSYYYPTVHQMETEYWGNTDPRWNDCNNYWFRSNGYGVKIQINTSHG